MASTPAGSCASRRGLGEREEYLDSEKYEIRARDWDAPGNIKLLIGELNRLRHERPALELYDNLRFENVSGERTLFYRKAMPLGTLDPLTGQRRAWRDPVYVAVNSTPASPSVRSCTLISRPSASAGTSRTG